VKSSKFDLFGAVKILGIHNFLFETIKGFENLFGAVKI
jgi:hypothetical protein